MYQICNNGIPIRNWHMLYNAQSNSWRPEDGQYRPKHVVLYLRIACVIIVVFDGYFHTIYWISLPEKYSNIKFHEAPSNLSRVILCGQRDARTDRHYEADSRSRTKTIQVSQTQLNLLNGIVTCFDSHVIVIRQFTQNTEDTKFLRVFSLHLNEISLISFKIS
jgi:hypothetical protein